MKRRLLPQLEGREKGDITVYIRKGEVSKFVGQKRQNMLYFKELGYNIKLVEKEGEQELFPKLEA